MICKAISLHQPWATFMALGLKTNETRHWEPYYRGDLVIHASKRWTDEQKDTAHRLIHGDKTILAAMLASGMRKLSDFPLGCVLCMVDFYDITKAEVIRPELTLTEAKLGNYDDGRFAWRTRNLRTLAEPLPWRGAQGFFNVELPDDLQWIEKELVNG